MLRFSEKSENLNIHVNLGALSIGGELIDSYLKTLFALGFERGIHIDASFNTTFYPEYIGNLIYSYITKMEKQDIIILGSGSVDGESMMVPYIIAEKLRMTVVSSVLDFEPIDESKIKVKHRDEENEYTSIVKLPCILTMGEIPSSYLRVPTLKQRMSSNKSEIINIKADGLCEIPKNEDETLDGFEYVDSSRQGKIIEGKDLDETIEILYEEHLKEWLKDSV
jgi:electron transfer flavoprotein alpha/beta subunit